MKRMERMMASRTVHLYGHTFYVSIAKVDCRPESAQSASKIRCQRSRPYNNLGKTNKPKERGTDGVQTNLYNTLYLAHFAHFHTSRRGVRLPLASRCA